MHFLYTVMKYLYCLAFIHIEYLICLKVLYCNACLCVPVNGV